MEDQSQRQLIHHIPPMSRRFYAFYADEGLRITFFLPFVLLSMGENLFRPEAQNLSWQGLLLAVVIYFGFRVLSLYLLGGSVGKILLGLRVINRNGGELTLMQALLRTLADELSIFFAFAPRALAYFRWDRTHLSDWIAETRVVSLKEQNFFPEARPLVGSVLVVLGLMWGVSNFI